MAYNFNLKIGKPVDKKPNYNYFLNPVPWASNGGMEERILKFVIFRKKKNFLSFFYYHFSKKGCFLSFEKEKWYFNFLAPPEKFFSYLWKKLFRRPRPAPGSDVQTFPPRAIKKH